MRDSRAQASLVLVLWAAVLIYIATLILGLVISLPVLVILNRAHLDAASSAHISSVITALLVVVVTGYGAWKVARRVDRAALLHGLLVGLTVALLSFLLDLLFRRVIELTGLILYLLMVASGALGGVLGSCGRERS